MRKTLGRTSDEKSKARKSGREGRESSDRILAMFLARMHLRKLDEDK